MLLPAFVVARKPTFDPSSFVAAEAVAAVVLLNEPVAALVVVHIVVQDSWVRLLVMVK